MAVEASLIVGVEKQTGSEPGGQTPTPLRRSRTNAASIAWNTHINEVPPGQVVSIWASQTRDTGFVGSIIDAMGVSEREKAFLLQQASRVIAENILHEIGYTATPRLIDDKRFAHWEFFT